MNGKLHLAGGGAASHTRMVRAEAGGPPLAKQVSGKRSPRPSLSTTTPLTSRVRDVLLHSMKRVIDTFHEWDTDGSQAREAGGRAG